MEFPSIDSFACKSVITVIASWHRAGGGGGELSRVGFGTQLVPRERGGGGKGGGDLRGGRLIVIEKFAVARRKATAIIRKIAVGETNLRGRA